jgi:hypothetical protein
MGQWEGLACWKDFAFSCPTVHNKMNSNLGGTRCFFIKKRNRHPNSVQEKIWTWVVGCMTIPLTQLGSLHPPFSSWVSMCTVGFLLGSKSCTFFRFQISYLPLRNLSKRGLFWLQLFDFSKSQITSVCCFLSFFC